MPPRDSFQHLPLLLTSRGPARLHGGAKKSPQTIANTKARQAHSESLRASAQALREDWETRALQREDDNLPIISKGIPILVQVDPSLELDVLREKFDFEIVAEQEDGYVIVASEDLDLTLFLEMVNAFAVKIHGSERIAKIHQLFPDNADRLSRILSEQLLARWPQIADDDLYVVDVGIACVGTREIPREPVRGKRDDDPKWARKQLTWSQARMDAYEAWDEIKRAREVEIEDFTRLYDAEILHLIDQGRFDAAVLPDSFTIRLKILGKGLRDFVLNYAYIFEVVEPDDIALPQHQREAGELVGGQAPTGPEDTAPAVCVIDSGIQEAHVLVEPAIDHATSRCFLPGKAPDEVGDFVSPSGHGTRVAGAVLYGEVVARDGASQLPFWVQNARVLDEYNGMPEELFPPAAVRAAVERFHQGTRNTRIFNHSINALAPCRTRYMSAWAAEIDLLCATYDILFVQSAGNVPMSSDIIAQPGVKEHLAAGRDYPKYLYEASTRVANPGQSLQALTVGSVAYGYFEQNDWKTFASQRDYPSAFSRSGHGIWSTIKPEVVEYGGDDVRTSNIPPDVQSGDQIAAACPELVRSTTLPGPLFDRSECGTSFAAPKVARIAAQLQQILPDEPALLYRALIVNPPVGQPGAKTSCRNCVKQIRHLTSKRS